MQYEGPWMVAFGKVKQCTAFYVHIVGLCRSAKVYERCDDNIL